jgi:hypothetical protein
MAATLPIGAVLAGRMLADRILMSSRYVTAALLVVLAAYLSGYWRQTW